MKSLITIIVASAGLSWPGASSVRSQEASEPPAAAPAIEQDEQELANALAEVQRQVEVELKPKLAAAAAEAGAKVQAAQRRIDAQLAQAQQAIELAQAAAPAGPRAVVGAAATSAPAYHTRLQSIVSKGRGGPGKALVIRTSDSDAKAQANLEEDLAVGHDAPLPVCAADQIPAHLRRDRGVDLTVQRPYPVAVDRHIALHDRHHFDLRRRCLACRPFLTATEKRSQQWQEQNAEGDPAKLFGSHIFDPVFAGCSSTDRLRPASRRPDSWEPEPQVKHWVCFSAHNASIQVGRHGRFAVALEQGSFRFGPVGGRFNSSDFFPPWNKPQSTSTLARCVRT